MYEPGDFDFARLDQTQLEQLKKTESQLNAIKGSNGAGIILLALTEK